MNADFGSIFSTLLPGARAKLEPQEGLPVEEGLIVKVGFGQARPTLSLGLRLSRSPSLSPAWTWAWVCPHWHGRAHAQVWKQSLLELSGGQRSLIALSLVLSLLRFKPAPIYILDEIDAALDLSHTQNIGTMIKAHFKQSQFLVVSLKEGMFNNANVIFRTKFVDNISTVTRTVPSAAAAAAAQEGAAPEAEAAPAAAKGKGKGKGRKALENQDEQAVAIS